MLRIPYWTSIGQALPRESSVTLLSLSIKDGKQGVIAAAG